MRTVIILSALSYSFLFAAELEKSISIQNAVTQPISEFAMFSRTSEAGNDSQIDVATNAFLQANDNVSTEWHIHIYNFMHYAQKQRYPLAAVKLLVADLEDCGIKTGWRYSIFTNEETEDDSSKQRIICFGMSMNMKDPDHYRTSFVIAPVVTPKFKPIADTPTIQKKKVIRLINNI